MNENVQKPMSVAIADLKDNLINVVNNSMLPPYIVEPLLKEVYMEVKSLSKAQYEKDKLDYERKLAEGTQTEEYTQEEAVC